MIEKLSKTDTKEILKPQNTPEMAFESFTLLVGDKQKREKSKEDFIEGKIINPDLDYPRINEQALDDGIRVLMHVLTIAEQFNGDEKATIWDSAAFRMADMFYLKSLLELQKQVQAGNQAKIDETSKKHQQLNEQLFGIPSREIISQIFGEAFRQIECKSLAPSADVFLDELKNGFTVEADGKQIEIPTLEKDTAEVLPVFEKAVLDKLENYLIRHNQDIFELVENYYQTHIINKPEGEKAFTPSDLFEIFKAVHSLRDSENSSGINIYFDDDATNLSWNTAKMAIVVGARRTPIKSIEDVIGLVIHEYGVHATRAVNGSKSELPTLGTGLFTEADEGENVDYLTFEEGFASLCQQSINHKKASWTPLDLEKTMAISLAYEGFDFRQSYEVLWRIRCLMLSKECEDVSVDAIARAKRNSYASLERVYRSTPSAISRRNSDGSLRVLTYNKDLAYLKGKLLAYNYLETATEEDLELLFKGKFDPTNHRQFQLAQRYLG